MYMERKQSTRIQTSLVNKAERKVLVWMAERMPRWITSDMLTCVGVLGAVIIAAGYVLSAGDYRWLWLASAGFVVNWFGDSLDGTLARVRNQQRPLYGFFLDHNVDGINETLMFAGLGLSPFMNMGLSMSLLAVYLLLSIYVYISAHLKGEFRLTYAKLGPTEFRLLAIIVNTLLVSIEPLRSYGRTWVLLGGEVQVGVLDYVGVVVLVVMVAMLLYSLIHDGCEYAKIDPPKRGSEN